VEVETLVVSRSRRFEGSNLKLEGKRMGAPEQYRGTELDDLAAEAQDARLAIRASMFDLKTALLTKLDPRALAREHPRMAVGLAAATGVAAGTVWGACQGRSVTSDVAPPVPPMADSSPAADPSCREGRRRGMLAESIARTFQGALGSALRLAIQSGFAAWSAAPAAVDEARPVRSSKGAGEWG
jgi:hypothetical protein